MTNPRVCRCMILSFVLVVVAESPLRAERPLPNDERNQTGKLSNGVAWVFRRHDKPAGQLAIMMHIRTGSLNETDAQRGVAHFLEHMVFNGTEHFKSGELVPYFESIGMKFGGDVNANTSFERTMYQLFLPKADAKAVGDAFKVLSDYAFRATLDPKQIDEERGVILEEARSRKNASQRIRDKLWPQLYAGARFAERLPIGTEEVITKAPPSEFEDYYRAWYRPENVTVVMVGDSDLDVILPLLTEWFGQYKSPLPVRPPSAAGVKPFAREQAIVLTDPEVTTGRVELMALLPGRPPVVTVERWRAELVEGIANHMFGRRCAERVRKGQASYRSAGTSANDFFHEATTVGGAASGEAADWAKMLEELITEIAQARQFGFTGQEFELVKRQLVSGRERAVRTESTRDSRTIVKELFGAVHDGLPVLSAEQELGLINELLPTIAVEEVSAVFRKMFSPAPWAYVLTLPEKDGSPVPSRDEVLALARSAWARKVEPPATRRAAEGLLAELPKPGAVVESVVEADLGVTSAWLANGARLHHRFMDYKKDSVTISITLAGGGIEETAANIGVTSVASLAVSNPATGRLDSTAIRDMMAGRNVSVGGGMAADDAFVVRVSGSPKDLEFGLQLAYALLTDGKIEDAVFRNWRLEALRGIEQNQTSVSFRCGEVLGEALNSGDPRRLSVKKSHVEALSVPQAQAWFDRLCREAPVEVAVVGDSSWDDVRPLIERYVGSLPKRERIAGQLDKLRGIRRPAGPIVKHVAVATITPAATASSGFVSCQGEDVEARRALSVAGSVLSSRLLKKVREELGLVYGISASNTAGWVYAESGRFQAGAKCKPENVEKVIAEIDLAFQEFAAKGPSAEELENARKQILNHLDTTRKEPQYWLDLLENHDLRRRSFDDMKTIREAYANMTGEQVRKAFAKYCTPDRRFAVTGVPVQPASKPSAEKANRKAAAQAERAVQ